MGNGNKKGDIKPSWMLPRTGASSKPESQLHSPVALSFRYFRTGSAQCLSNCNQDEVRHSIECLRKITTMTWNEVRSTGGSPGNKVGLGYSVYTDSQLKGVSRPPTLSAEIPICGVRISDRMRMFGGYKNHIFYVLWFDPAHEIVPFRKHR